MRNLVLVLLFANLVYFLWTRSIPEPTVDTGVVRVDERRLQPLAELAPASQARRQSANTGPVCLSVGSFSEQASAETELAKLRAAGVGAAIRKADGEVLDAHWVQVLGFADRSAANVELGKLQNGGIAEAYIVGDEAAGFSISLGLFSELQRAERVELQAKALGVDATITERMRSAEVFWIDIERRDSPGLDEWLADNDALVQLTGNAANCP